MKLIVIAIFLLPLFIFGQKIEGNIEVQDYQYPLDLQNPPWDNLPCDTLLTQYEMNCCAKRKTDIADSIMYDLLRMNIEYFEKLVESEKIDMPSSRDSTLLKYYLREIELLKISQKKFEEYRQSMVDFEGNFWSTGTIRPMMELYMYLDETVHRVEMLKASYEFFKTR